MNVEKRLTIVIAAVMVILIIGGLSLLLYSKARFKDYYFKYGEFDVHKVVSRNGIWYELNIFVGEKEVQSYIISVRNDPRELENITVDIRDIKKSLIKPQLFITMDKEATGLSVVAGVEISKIIGNPFLYKVPIEGALTTQLNNQTLIVKTCNDVNERVGVIYLKQSKDVETKVYDKNGCIVITGKNEYEIIKGADKLVLTLLGVMKKE